MLILSSGPLRTGSTLWHTRKGGFVLTVVCKATYWLKPGEAVLAAEQEAVNEADDHWDDDPNRSVRAPSDLMPNKIRPEVTLVGYAYAPNNQPVRSLVARMIVGDIDKSIEVHNDRTFLADGSLQEGARFTRMRLTWERAGGGPGTSNPVGLRADARDAYGRRQVPNLQPIGTYVSTPDDFVPPVGFGPIAATWPPRADLLVHAPQAAGEGLEGPTAIYYNAAPQDQQLSMLRVNERIVLEYLHPEHPRLVTNLPGYRPAIFVERTQGMAPRVSARADSLWIDTDRGIATLTWRALIPLARKDEPGRVLVAFEPPGRELTWGEVVHVMSSEPSTDEDDEPIETITSMVGLVHPAAALPFTARPAAPQVTPPRDPHRPASMADMPFQRQVPPSTPPPAAPHSSWPTLQSPPAPPPLQAAPVPSPSSPRSARSPLPGTVVGSNAGAPPPPAPVTPPPPAVAAIPPMSPSATPSRPPPVPPPPVRPSAVSLSELSPPSQEKPHATTSPWAGGGAGVSQAQPQTIGTLVAAAAAALVDAPKEPSDGGALSAAAAAASYSKPPDPITPSATPVPPRVSRPSANFDDAFGGSKAAPTTSPAPPRASRPSGSFDAAFGGVRAASDAAAERSAAAEAPRERAIRVDVGAEAAQPPRRQAVVSLLCFDAQMVPRIRRNKRFAAALAQKARPRRAQGLDEPMKEAPPDERSDVLRVLSYGTPVDAPEIRRALADCLDDLDELDPPVLLVGGEMRPTFDEVEALRTTIAVAQQVAGGDKKVLAAIAVGQEALAAPVVPRSETTLGLVRQIEQAAASLSLPARYVPAEVERVLTEGRKYKRRTLLGAPRVRADLAVSRGGEVMPVYVPESASTSLPQLLSFPVVALCEVIPREDLTETQDEALVVGALGRVLRSR